jgi:hypothetical protein
MTTAYSGYGIPTPDFTDLNRTAHRIWYKHNIYKEGKHLQVQHKTGSKTLRKQILFAKNENSIRQSDEVFFSSFLRQKKILSSVRSNQSNYMEEKWLVTSDNVSI